MVAGSGYNFDQVDKNEQKEEHSIERGTASCSRILLPAIALYAHYISYNAMETERLHKYNAGQKYM